MLYGALVFVFQQGHFQQVLGFASDGFIDRFIPILLFCILFGLSMDYEVFLMARVREEWLHTHDNRASVALGLEKTGGVITNAALLFVIVTSSFILTSLTVTKEFGLALTVSLLVDASIIRCMLVPASMQLMGKWNWWFPWRLPPFRRDGGPSLHEASPLSIAPPIPFACSTSHHLLGDEQNQSLSKQNEVVQILIRIFAQTLNQPQELIEASSDFFQLGGDADTLAGLLGAIEQDLQVQITPNDVFDHTVLSCLAAVVHEHIAQRHCAPNGTL